MKVDPFLAFPIIAAVALMAADNANFMFDPPGMLDPFVFVGYFWHYPAHLPLFDVYYKISRLPWILPGYVAHRLAGEVAGSYLLHFTTLTAGAVALYLLVRGTLKDRVPAAIVAVAWTSCSWVHGNSGGGWNYQVLAAGSYYMWAYWLTLRAASEHAGRTLPVFAGIALSCAVHTHLFFIVFTPFLLALYLEALARPLSHRVRRVSADSLLALAGVLVSTIVLAAVNGFTGGDWLFFMPQIRYTLWLSEPGHNQWVMNPRVWLPSARHLVIPLLCLVAGTLSAWRYGTKNREARFALLFVLQGWAALALMSFFQFARGQTVLDWSYMAFPLYCHAFPALAAALWRPETLREGRIGTFATVATAAAAIVLPLLFLMPAALPGLINTCARVLGLAALPAVAGPLIVGLASVAGMAALGARASVVTCGIWFSLINIWIAPQTNVYGFHTAGIQRDMLRLFRDADRFTTDLDPTLLGIKYWFQPEILQTAGGPVDMAPVFHSYVSTRAWLGNLLAQKAPASPLADLRFEDLQQPGRCLGVLSSIRESEDIRLRLQKHFEEIGHPLRDVATRTFVRPALSFSLMVFSFTQPHHGVEGEPPGVGQRGRCSAESK
jgi:hypothetical protein